MSSGARCTRTVIAILRDIAASAAVSSPTSNAAPVRKERRCPSISCSQWPLCGGAQRRRGGPRLRGRRRGGRRVRSAWRRARRREEARRSSRPCHPYGCTPTRNRAAAEHETARPRNSSSSSEKEERSFDGSLFRQRPPASGQPKAGARNKHIVEIFVDTGIHSWVGIPLRS